MEGRKMKLNFWEKWFTKQKPFHYTKVLFADSLSDVPTNIGKHIYIVGTLKMKWVVFSCPNNCGRRVEVNLMKSKYPNWTLRLKRKKVSLCPSVVVDCGAHFYLTKNKVIEAKFIDEE
jgi:hypothetical protein